MPDLDDIFPLYGDDEVSDKDLAAITAIATGGPRDMTDEDTP